MQLCFSDHSTILLSYKQWGDIKCWKVVWQWIETRGPCCQVALFKRSSGLYAVTWLAGNGLLKLV